MWSTARCSAVVQRVLQGGKWCRVKWDIDGAITQVAVQDLHVDEIPSADSSEETVVSDVRTVLPACQVKLMNTVPRKVKFPQLAVRQIHLMRVNKPMNQQTREERSVTSLLLISGSSVFSLCCDML